MPRTIKPWWLIAAFFSGLAFAMWAEELILNVRETSRVDFSVPRTHFLTGKPLARMHNSDQVPFLIRATLWSGNKAHVLKDTVGRFLVSYDLFEEKFSVRELEPARKSVDRLTDVGAETWCLQQMSIDVTGVGGSEPLWARLDIRALDGKENNALFSKADITDSGISLNSITAKMIELFSRPAQGSQPHWGPYEAGPITLDELRRSRR
jgi:hypothetical protein